MIQKWNKLHNLTSITVLNDMIIKHTLDSLSIGKFLEGNTFLDLGSGAGFPGIPLSIVFPNKYFYLAEKSHKKQIFLTHVKNNLQITNIGCIVSNVGQFNPPKILNGILIRAFSPIKFILQTISHLFQKNCKLYIMLGNKIDNLNLNTDIFSYNIIPIDVPYSNFKRHLLLIEKL